MKHAHCTIAVTTANAATEDFLSPRNGKESAKTWKTNISHWPAASCMALPKSLDYSRKYYYKHCFTTLDHIPWLPSKIDVYSTKHVSDRSMSSDKPTTTPERFSC